MAAFLILLQLQVTHESSRAISRDELDKKKGGREVAGEPDLLAILWVNPGIFWLGAKD